MKLALGVFDGVHKGHQKIIEKAHRVITFDPHPNPGRHLLTTIAERNALIGNLDVIKFTRKIQNMYPQDFIEQIIVKKYKPEVVIVGHDYAFGYSRAGDVRLLIALGKKFGFEVDVVPEIKLDGEPVRSSSIRKFLAQGDVVKAADYLSREYSLSGKVVHGAGRGSKLGFPTINVTPSHPNKLVPGEGVYKGDVIVDNKLYKAAIFIGERQTFNEHERVIEAHILGFHGGVYGKKATIFFNEMLREEKKFSNQEDLIFQIKKDIALVKEKQG